MSITLPPLPDLPRPEYESDHALNDSQVRDYATAYATAAVEADRASRVPMTDAQIAALTAERDALAHSCKTLGWINERNILAMQAAWIASESESAAEGMIWIENTLDGPDLLPDEDEILAFGGAQEWFDAQLMKLGDLPQIGAKP